MRQRELTILASQFRKTRTINLPNVNSMPPEQMHPAERPFTISRQFDAPLDLVWKAWTDSEHMGWWGPKGVAVHHARLELHPGGVFHYCMRTPEGRDSWGKWVIREVHKPHRLVFVNSFSDQAGGITRHPMSPTWPLEMLSTVTFAEQGARTFLTVMWLPINPTDEERKTFDAGHESMRSGWTGTFERLAEYLKHVQHAAGH